MSDRKERPTIHRVGGYLHRFEPIVDDAGRVVERVLRPLMVEFRLRDMVQVCVGSSILAIPVAFTQETWDLGRVLPIANVAGLAVLSLVFIALFVHFHFYKEYLREYVFEYVKRVLATYLLSLLVVAVILTLIRQAPWAADWVLALKRVVIVTFPASLSAALTDSIK